MKKRFHLLLPVLACSLWLAGCLRDDSAPRASELDEPNYRQGEQLKKQGRYQEALTAYLKVIAKRDEDAPESHLEVGLIYSQNMRNYIAAIYHFNKYLELQPNSRQAALIRQQIDGAKRAFARTLPAQLPEATDDRADLQAQVARLQQENDLLKTQLAAARGSAAAQAMPASSVPAATPVSGNEPSLSLAPIDDTAAGSSSITLAPMTTTTAATVSPPAAITRPNSSTKGSNARQAAVKSPAPTPAATTARKHVVAVKESLWSIARKYYGPSASAAKVQGILDANRAILPDAAALKPGMELKIP